MRVYENIEFGGSIDRRGQRIIMFLTAGLILHNFASAF